MVQCFILTMAPLAFSCYICIVVVTWKPYYSLMILMRAFHKPLPLRIGNVIPITSTVTCTVNLLPIVAIKVICSCFSQPLYLKAAVLILSPPWLDLTIRFVTRTCSLSLCAFSEAGVSKVIAKITLLSLLVAKKRNQIRRRGLFCKILETIEHSGKGFI